METWLWDGHEGVVRDGRESGENPARDVALGLSQGGAKQQGHPVPLRDEGVLGPLSSPDLSQTNQKGKKERGSTRNRSQLSPIVLLSTRRLQPQGKCGRERSKEYKGPVMT